MTNEQLTLEQQLAKALRENEEYRKEKHADKIEIAKLNKKIAENNKLNNDSMQGKHTNATIKWLQEHEKMSSKDVKKLENESNDIASSFAHLAYDDSFNFKGLVVGDIQSGKTMNMIMTANRAIDCGFNNIIIFSGLTNDLRDQTQERFEQGLVGYYTDVNTNSDPTKTYFDEVDLHTVYDSDKVRATSFPPNKINVFIVKKNKKIIEALLKKLCANQKDAENFTTLIIDDECDQASPNIKYDQDELSAINQGIVNIKRFFNKCVYLGYTATPFANVLMEEEEELYPSNLIHVIKDSDEYTGYAYYDKSESFFQATIFDEDYQWLIEPINYFLQNCTKGTNYSLMINTSPKIYIHEEVERQIYNLLHKENLDVNNIDINILNSNNTNKVDWTKNNIIIGGMKLSRGLTIKNLIVSVVHNNSVNYDTYAQYCRWFGYRKNYGELVRLYATQDYFNAYNEFFRCWYKFRELLEQVNKNNNMFDEDIQLRIAAVNSEISKRNMVPTSRNKSRGVNAYFSKSRKIVHVRRYQTIKFENSDFKNFIDEIELNSNTIKMNRYTGNQKLFSDVNFNNIEKSFDSTFGVSIFIKEQYQEIKKTLKDNLVNVLYIDNENTVANLSITLAEIKFASVHQFRHTLADIEEYYDNDTLAGMKTTEWQNQKFSRNKPLLIISFNRVKNSDLQVPTLALVKSFTNCEKEEMYFIKE